MILQLLKAVLAALLLAPLRHRLVYGLFAILYLGSCFGLDKMAVSALVACGYAVLALERP